jgi:hypothetical protein
MQPIRLNPYKKVNESLRNNSVIFVSWHIIVTTFQRYILNHAATRPPASRAFAPRSAKRPPPRHSVRPGTDPDPGLRIRHWGLRGYHHPIRRPRCRTTNHPLTHGSGPTSSMRRWRREMRVLLRKPGRGPRPQTFRGGDVRYP